MRDSERAEDRCTVNLNVVNFILCESYRKNLSFFCLDIFRLSEVSLPELVVGLEAL